MDDKQRIQEVLSYTRLSARALAEEIGLKSPQSFYDIKAGRHGISKELASKIQGKYLNISTEWLLTGEGEMLTTDNAPPEEEKGDGHTQLIPAPPGKGIPLIPLPAMAGFLKGSADLDRNDIEWYYVPAFSDCTFLIRVKGDSMYPRYLSGDIVACREVHDTGTFFQWGKAYVLDTDQGVVLKRIRRSERPDHILCVSDNPDYEPFDVPVSSIYHLAIVRGLIREE